MGRVLYRYNFEITKDEFNEDKEDEEYENVRKETGKKNKKRKRRKKKKDSDDDSSNRMMILKMILRIHHDLYMVCVYDTSTCIPVSYTYYICTARMNSIAMLRFIVHLSVFSARDRYYCLSYCILSGE